MMRCNDDERIKKAMLAELKIIILIGQHLNIVNFLGAVDDKNQNHDLMIVLEYCPYGNILDFIRINKSNFIYCSSQSLEAWRTDSTISDVMTSEEGLFRTRFNTKDLICWSKQIADGMAFLKSKNVCHGDLAARNVLLCEKNVVKISDFGLARAYNYGGYYKKAGKDRLPYKWLALESMSHQIFNVATDVWSYGVLLWEVFSLGVTPYPGIPLDDSFYTLLLEGYRMEKPRYANGKIYDIMCMCWKADPKLRPSFANLANMFNAMIPSDLQDHYMSLNDPYNDENNRCLNDDNQ
ncbi:platelet-derived growth factor receptor alpha-like [Anopheles ziemanni]|uniref:platelet-derived growth factor receptor alpha-like n=1 Tax=Anopheles ziemanni TaxID=345580 RepID=UPI00265E7859|nr:platelet-derived growth factor receptor alpha-like [Anopheles ziemanni]